MQAIRFEGGRLRDELMMPLNELRFLRFQFCDTLIIGTRVLPSIKLYFSTCNKSFKIVRRINITYHGIPWYIDQNKRGYSICI